MFIAGKPFSSGSVRKSGIRSDLRGIAMPLFRTEESYGVTSSYKHRTPS